MQSRKIRSVNIIEYYASKITTGAGSNATLLIAFIVVMIWCISGAFMHFSEQWALIMSTGSSAITFLMVFLIQKSQNKDSMATQLKLNELVAANELASNRLVDVEGMTEEELKVIQKYYSKLSIFSQKQESLQQSHSIDEQHEEHEIKKEMEEELLSINNEPSKK
jgi:low affinity Fe/Cu permease